MLTVKGKITHTGKPLANVNIRLTDANGNWYPVNGNNVFRTSNSDGTFVIPVTNEDSFVTFTSVGFKVLSIPAEAAARKSEFKMQVDEQALPEVAIKTSAPRPRAHGRAEAQALASMPDLKFNKKYLIIGAAVAGVILVGTIIYFMLKKK